MLLVAVTLAPWNSADTILRSPVIAQIIFLFAYSRSYELGQSEQCPGLKAFDEP
jgi:hypothetical protein